VSQGVQIRPSFALGSWLALKQSGQDRAVAMGDLVLTEEEPRLLSLHFWANGDAVKLAPGLRAALHHTNLRRPATR